MGTLVAGAPLLAAGPPGWLAYAALAVGSVVIGGALIMSSSKNKEKEKTRTQVETDTQTCRNCTWTVRTHAQGTDIGGTSSSTIGAPPVALSTPIPALTGAANAHSTYALLTNKQATIRTEAFARALKWLSERPMNGGFLGKQSFEVLGVRGGIRFDIDSFGPSNNFVN